MLRVCQVILYIYTCHWLGECSVKKLLQIVVHDLAKLPEKWHPFRSFTKFG